MNTMVTIIAAAAASAMLITALAVPAMADTREQYVTEDNGVTTVHITT